MKIGIYQASAGGTTLAQRSDMLHQAISQQSVDLVVCPELFATGYHLPDTHQQLAEPVDGRYFQAFTPVAQQTSTAIVFGYPESFQSKVYNSACMVSPHGELLANHRKQRASPNSFEVDTFSNGSTQTMVDYNGVTIAILICYEVELCEFARALALSGAELLLVPTALVDQWGVVAQKVVPSRAFENGMWVAYANYAGSEMSFRYLGGSRIVAPNGAEAVVAGEVEQLIVTDIDTQAVKQARARLPYLEDAASIANSS